jgi:aspartyl-tRNA(Asn)/glutamyl-tRNA(Gln) amidotransferase subunit A
VPLQGVVPLAARFDTVGPLCRSVEDAAHLLALLEGGTPADLSGTDLTGTRLMLLETVALDDLRAGPAQGFESAATRLSAAGATITRAQAPEVAEAIAMSAILFTSEAYGIWKDVIEAAPEKMFRPILDRFRAGAEFTAADYVAAWRRLEELRVIWAERTAGYHAVILPTAPNLPPNLDRLMTDSAFYVTENLLTLRNTRIGNLMGLCGLTLPTGVPSTGLMLLAPPMAEERLLRLGAAAEAALRG